MDYGQVWQGSMLMLRSDRPLRCRAGIGLLLIVSGALQGGAGAARAASPRALAAQVLAAEGVRPGLYVHLGCGDGRLTAALSGGGRNWVHGLSDHPDTVSKARKVIEARGVYGKVSVDYCSFKYLPYARDMVDLVVAEEYGKLAKSGLAVEEVMRVLCPGGTAFIGGVTKGALADEKVRGARPVKIGGRTWVRMVKGPLQGVDEWGQYLHDAGRSGVSRDRLVGPPTGLRWVGGFPWVLGADRDSSMVTSGGRIFYRIVIDRRRKSGKIAARDAYNGILLWEKDVPRVPPWDGFVAAGDRLFTVQGRSVARRTVQRLRMVGW